MACISREQVNKDNIWEQGTLEKKSFLEEPQYYVICDVDTASKSALTDIVI